MLSCVESLGVHRLKYIRICYYFAFNWGSSSKGLGSHYSLRVNSWGWIGAVSGMAEFSNNVIGGETNVNVRVGIVASVWLSRATPVHFPVYALFIPGF